MNCSQPFVRNDNESSEAWQIPSFFNRDMFPVAYKRPTSCPLNVAVQTESAINGARGGVVRNSSGGTEGTLGPRMQGPTPFDFNHPYIAQPRDNRLEQVFTRDNGNYPRKYSSAPGYVTTA